LNAGKAYDDVVRGLRENQNLIVFCAITFLMSASAGALSYSLFKDRMPEILDQVFGEVMAGSDHDVIRNIFLRNLTASSIIMLSGITIIAPVFLLYANGYLTGLVLMFARENGLSTTIMLAGIIPHGVFELPALFISSAAGMRVGITLLTSRGKRIKATSEKIRGALKTYALLVLPLLAIAAILEILVSKRLIT
jgi:stage II sporulation protein M